MVTSQRKEPARLLSITAAAEEYGISVWTLRDLVAAGDLPSIRPPKVRRIWIERKALEQALVAWTDRGNGGSR